MAHREAKFCKDGDGIWWSLLEGIITRKTPQDEPTGGKQLPVERVTGVEKRTLNRVRRSRLAWPLMLLGAG